MFNGVFGRILKRVEIMSKTVWLLFGNLTNIFPPFRLEEKKSIGRPIGWSCLGKQTFFVALKVDPYKVTKFIGISKCYQNVADKLRNRPYRMNNIIK